MRCPTCDVDLIGSDRLGVKTGYCPECEGEWFGRGAVERLLARAAARPQVTEAAAGPVLRDPNQLVSHPRP